MRRLSYLPAVLDFLIGTRLESIPDRVRADGRTSLMDTLGCVLGGMSAAPVEALARRVAGQHGAASLLGTARRTTPMYAVLVGVAAGAWRDLDSGHRHPSTDPPIPGIQPPLHLVPVLMAVGEQHGISGADLLRMYLVSYELTARLGIATRMRAGLHGHGLHSAVGAGVAAALASGAERDRLDRALRLSASLCVLGPMQAALDGASVRNAFAGVGAANGLLANDLAVAGFTANGDPLTDVFGTVASDDFSADRLLDGLGQRWEAALGYYKVHACCRWNHPTLDALEDLAAAEPIAAASVEKVAVRTFQFAAGISNPNPSTELGAKFSLPYAVAAFLVLGSTGFQAFSEDALWRPDVRALAQRVSVREDPAYSAALPARRPTTVEVYLRDGTLRSATVDGSRGDPSRPFPPGVLRAKFLQLAGAAVGVERARAAYGLLQEIEKLDSVRSLVRTLTPGIESASLPAGA